MIEFTLEELLGPDATGLSNEPIVFQAPTGKYYYGITADDDENPVRGMWHMPDIPFSMVLDVELQMWVPVKYAVIHVGNLNFYTMEKTVISELPDVG